MALQTVVTLTVSLLCLWQTPYWPVQLSWAGLPPVLMGIALLQAPVAGRFRHLFRVMPLHAGLMVIGSLVPPETVAFLPVVAMVGLLCGFLAIFGLAGASAGVTGFVIFAAASTSPLGEDGLPTRLLTALGSWLILAAAVFMLRWPNPPSLSTLQKRFFRKLARVLARREGESALAIQPYLRALLLAARANPPSVGTDEPRLELPAAMRNGVLLLVQALDRLEGQRVLSADRTLMAEAAAHAQAVLIGFERGIVDEEALARLQALASETETRVADVLEPGHTSLSERKARAEAHYAVVSLYRALADFAAAEKRQAA